MNKLFKYKPGIWMSVTAIAITLISVCYTVASCGEMSDNYQQYLEGGEIIYPGKADSLQVYSGKYRVELQWLITSDPSISAAIIYWNNKQNSTQVPISRTAGVDTVRVTLENLDEQTYTFEVYTLDADGNKSVATEVIGTAYGDKYRTTLFNRAMRSVELTEEGDLQIAWETADDGTIAEELVFTDTKGNIHTLTVDADSNTVLLPNYDLSKNLVFTTVFKPDPTSIDTFKVAHEEIAFDVEETLSDVPRSGFSVKDLPGDHSESNAVANSLSNIWTNPYNTTSTPFISKAWTLTQCDDLVPFPYWFTIDMGAAYNVSSFTLFQRGGAELYKNSNLKQFEIWGALEVDETYNPSDHGDVFDNHWVLLSQCEIIPPADQSTWAAEADKGHTFDLRAGGQTQRIRYLRIKAIDNWQPLNGTCPVVKKRTYINIASIRLEAVQKIVQLIKSK
jgi:hypothetical protein